MFDSVVNTSLMFTITLRYHERNKSVAFYHTSQICLRLYYLAKRSAKKSNKKIYIWISYKQITRGFGVKKIYHSDRKNKSDRWLTKYHSSWDRIAMEWRECRWQVHYQIRITYQLLGSWFLFFCSIIAMILQTKFNRIIFTTSFLNLLNVSTIISYEELWRKVKTLTLIIK